MPTLSGASTSPASRTRKGVIHPILGIVDHGSRLAVLLAALRTRTTIAILCALLDAIERYGLPRAARTDNDGAFKSWLFGFALALLGINHQRTEPHCPWMNGRPRMLAVALWLWLLRILFPFRRRPSRGRRFVPTPFSALRARKPTG